MYKRICFALVLLVGISACKNGGNKGCGMVACTQIYTQIGIFFQDNQGNGVDVTGLKVVNLRTNKELTQPLPTPTQLPGSHFTIFASDTNLNEISAQGDDIRVTATYAATGQTISVIEKLAGGKCQCHVARISGPETVQFN
ncbi:hypothetical protein [Mucilaginibacter segetis]|uniref:Uncharacterized protein n=1 Tax=Mucilaginibacter segetis TaxID=2793071 RepID=A0A934PX49_9SPHI|nr:hypothetical protein [Mucilaginibacter segetis]MBK0380711.1 hypothetical protein [Mucilaginibacter segetis]